jgi:hypothetical protein
MYADPEGPKTYESGSESGTLVHLHHSSKIKSYKEVTKQIKIFSYYLCLMMEGSVLVTNGSGSGRPKRYGSYGLRSGSATLLVTHNFLRVLNIGIV